MLPESFLNSLQGFDKESFIRVHEQGEQVTSLRLNPAKLINKSAHTFLNNTIPIPIPWCSNGFYLAERPSFVVDPLWHAGAYYVQEASSMFIQYILDELDVLFQNEYMSSFIIYSLSKLYTPRA